MQRHYNFSEKQGKTCRNGGKLLYLQRFPKSTFNLARMNMLLHGVKFSDIYQLSGLLAMEQNNKES